MNIHKCIFTYLYFGHYLSSVHHGTVNIIHHRLPKPLIQINITSLYLAIIIFHPYIYSYVCMYVCVCVCMHVCMHKYIYICVYIYICIYLYIYIYKYIHMCIYMYVPLHVTTTSFSVKFKFIIK
jgi:hypothetical protein